MKAWRLGAAVLNKIEGFIDTAGVQHRWPAARVVKHVATTIGVKLKTKAGSSRFVSQSQAQRFQPSGYVAPRRRGLRGEGFNLVGTPHQVLNSKETA